MRVDNPNFRNLLQHLGSPEMLLEDRQASSVEATTQGGIRMESAAEASLHVLLLPIMAVSPFGPLQVPLC